MRTYLLFFVIFCCNLSLAKGQVTGNNHFVDRNYGNLLYHSQFESVKGSQFHPDEWLNGQLTANDGTMYKNLRLKFDAYNNKVVFNRNDTSFEVDPPAKEIRLFTADTLVFKNGYTISPKIKAAMYLQVLAEGKITLLKQLEKNIEEYTEFSDATKYKRFTETYRYYIYTGNQYQEIKMSKKGLEDVLQDHWPAVSAYLSQKKLNQKDEKSWTMAITYYNSIQ